MTATARPQLATSAGSELKLQTDLPFAARQELRDGAERGSLTLLTLNGRRIGVVEKIEKLEETLHPEPIPNHKSLCDAQVHIHERRGCKSVPACFQTARAEVAVAVLIEWLGSDVGVAEPALCTENAAELNLPWEFHETMDFEGVAKGEVGRATVEFGAIIKDTRFRNVVAIASDESSGGIRSTRALSRTWVGNHRRNTAKAICGKAVAACFRSSTEIGVERIVVLGDVGVAAAQCKASAHTLFEGKNPRVVLAGIPRAKAVDKGNGRVVVNARRERQIRLADAEDVLDVLVVVVGAEDPIVGELALNAESIAAAVGRGETGIDGYWEIAGLVDQKLDGMFVAVSAAVRKASGVRPESC